MIRFNRVLQPFYALTFDLDDTLYDNRPIITQAEQKLFLFLQSNYSGAYSLNITDYHKIRHKLLKYEPDIYHDATYWRWSSIRLALHIVGFNLNEAASGADSAMEVLIYWRNKINVTSSTHSILNALSNRWPLVAITNGNANPCMFGLNKYFSYVFRSGIDGRAKPYKDMYCLASKQLGISCKNILHIGNDLITDVYGSINCGMQSCWVNEYNINYRHNVMDKNFVPHIEVSRLLFLTELLL